MKDTRKTVRDLEDVRNSSEEVRSFRHVHGHIKGAEDYSKHPYTKALMKAVFKVDFRPGEKIEPIEGEIPSPLDLPPGCPFASRCEHCTEQCMQQKPALKEVEHGHWVACHLYK